MKNFLYRLLSYIKTSFSRLVLILNSLLEIICNYLCKKDTIAVIDFSLEPKYKQPTNTERKG
jgi:hypothetical protein